MAEKAVVVNRVLVAPGSHVTCCGVSEDDRMNDNSSFHWLAAGDERMDCRIGCGFYRQPEIRSEMAQWGACCYLASG